MQDLKQIVDDLHLEDLGNEVHPSFFDENDDYDMLIMRLPVFINGLEVKSIGFVLTSEKAYIYNKSKKLFEDIGDRFDGPYKIINKTLDAFLKRFTSYQESVENMEEILYEDKVTETFMKDWIDLKRDLIRTERILLRASVILNQVIEFYTKEEKFPINGYVDIHEHMERAMRSASLHLSKLDYIYNFYTARTNEKMNKMIYFLTMISAIFLPLNLAVGFFGMNTSGLPFIDGGNGTMRAIVVILSLLILSSGIIYFWKGKTDKST